MDESREADDLRRRLQQSRARLTYDARRCKQSVREATNWRALPRKHPWLLLAGAAAAGFLAIPLKRTIAVYQADGQVWSRMVGVAKSAARPGVTATLGTMLVQMLLRTAVTIVTRRLGASLEARHEHDDGDSSRRVLPR